METLSEKLLQVVDRLPSLSWRSVWSALHGACAPHDDGYAERVGLVFGALRIVTDTSQTYLDRVLHAHWKADTFADDLRAAAERLCG